MTIKKSQKDSNEIDYNNHQSESPVNLSLNKIKVHAIKKRIEQLNYLKQLNTTYFSKHCQQSKPILSNLKVIKMQLVLPFIPFCRHYIHTDKSIKLFRPGLQNTKYLHKGGVFMCPPLNNQLEINKLMCLIVCNTLNQEMLFRLFSYINQKQGHIKIPDILKNLSDEIDAPVAWILRIWYQNSIYFNLKEEKSLEQLNYDLCDVCWLFNCTEHIKFSRYLKLSTTNPKPKEMNTAKQHTSLNRKEKTLLNELIPLFSSTQLIIKLLNLKTGKNFSREFITEKISASGTERFPLVFGKKILPSKLYTENDYTKSPLPCSHKGLCLNNPLCSCYLNSIYCNSRCGCLECNIQFPTCECKNCNIGCFCKKNSVSCHNCNCKLCYNKDFVEKDLQIKISEVQGLGLFANEIIKKGEFIIEYTGEIINFHTAEFRGRIYENFKCSYIFDLPNTFYEHDTSIDSMSLGNKARFINHSDTPNIMARTLKDNEKHKIMFFALRDIEKNEELFFTYNYAEDLKNKFGL